MKNKLLIVLLAITTTAMAGTYLSFQGGLGAANDIDIKKSIKPTGDEWTDSAIKLTLKMPFNLNLAFGYQMNDLRVAIDFGIATIITDKMTDNNGKLLSDFTYKDMTGNLQLIDKRKNNDISPIFIMLNGFYDFKLGEITPYIGLGFGYVIITKRSFEYQEYTENDTKSFLPQAEIGKDNVFGYNLIAGLSYNLNNNWNFFAEYKFAVANKSKIVYKLKTREVNEYLPNLYLHMFTLGLRYHIA